MNCLIEHSLDSLLWGEKIEYARMQLHITQKGLCAAVHMSLSTIRRLKKGWYKTRPCPETP